MSADVLKFLPVVQYYIISLWNMTSGICLATPWNIAPHFALKASSDLHCDLLYKWFSEAVTNSIGFPLEYINDVDVNKHASTQLKTGFWWVTCHYDNFKLHCRYTSYGTFWNTFNRAQPKNKIYLQSNRKWSMTETFFHAQKNMHHNFKYNTGLPPRRLQCFHLQINFICSHFHLVVTPRNPQLLD